MKRFLVGILIVVLSLSMILVLHGQQELRESYAGVAQALYSCRVSLHTVMYPDHSGILNAVQNTVLVKIGDLGHGSGVVIKDGFVLTARHCTLGGDPVIQTPAGEDYAVKQIWRSMDSDVAILWVPGIRGGCEFADASKLQLLDEAYVIGAPFDRDYFVSISEGILSRFGYDIYEWYDIWQVTCDAGPGNSGGPVVDNQGRVIGIVVAGPVAGGPITIIEPVTHILDFLDWVEQYGSSEVDH